MNDTEKLIEALKVTMRRLRRTLMPDQYNAILIFADVLIHELTHLNTFNRPSPDEPMHKTVL